PGLRAAFELEHVALGHRQEILHVLGGAEGDRLAELQRGCNIGQDDGGGAVGDKRAVRALERPCHARILLALGAAELVAEIFANLGIGIGDAVLVVLGGNARKRVGLIAPTLEVARGDLAENTGEAAVAGADPGVGEGLARNSNDQALEGFALEPAKRRVRPANDASRHGGLLSISSLYVIYGHWIGQPSRSRLTCRTLDVFSYHERLWGASAQHRRRWLLPFIQRGLRPFPAWSVFLRAAKHRTRAVMSSTRSFIARTLMWVGVACAATGLT